MRGLVLVISPSSRYALCKYKTAYTRNSARQTPCQPPASSVTFGLKACFKRFSDVLSKICARPACSDTKKTS